MKKIPLHLQIVIALILGAAFGALLPVKYDALVVATAEGSDLVDNWISARLMTDDAVRQFSLDERAELYQAFAELTEAQLSSAALEVELDDRSVLEYSQVTGLEDHSSIATFIKPFGILFLNLLKMIAIPLVLGSLIIGAASLGDTRKMARVGGKTIAFYLVTTCFAISLGLLWANLLQPGDSVPQDVQERLMTQFSEEAAAKMTDSGGVDFFDFILSIVPTNPFQALADGKMLHIVFFAVFFGMILSVMPREKSQTLLHFFEGLSEVSIRMVDVVMLLAPIGVFALMASTIASFGIEILQTLSWYVLAVVAGLFFHMIVVYPGILLIFSKIKILDFFRGIRRAQLVAFSTSSSGATLPVTMECADDMGVPKTASSFVLPLGATINMDGTALYQGVAAVFIAQVFNIDLTLGDQLGIVLTATLASIGTAPVPGVGLVMLIVVLQQAGIPAEGIALILGVDRILDMLRTAVNVTGDASASVFVAATEGLMDRIETKKA